MKWCSMPSVTTKSAMTPSRMGLTTWIVSGALPTISSASFPTARIRVPSRLTATSECSWKALLVGAARWISPIVNGDQLALCPPRGELARHVLISPLDMPGVAQEALSFGAHGCDHERGARSDVRDLHVSPAQPAWPMDHRVETPFDSDPGAHLRELVHVLETILVHILRDDRFAVRLGHRRHVLGLEVSGETGKRPRRHVVGLQSARRLASDLKPSLASLDFGPGLLELQEHHVEALRPAALQSELAPRSRNRQRVSSSLEVIGDDRVLGAPKVRDSVDHNPVGADALDAGTHLDEQAAESLGVRFTRCVENVRPALGEHCCQQDVLCACNRGQVEDYAFSVQTVGLRKDLGLRLGDASAHLAQRPKVLLDAARTDVVAARARQARPSKAPKQSSEQHYRRPHAPAQVAGHLAGLGARHMQNDGALALRTAAEPAEDLGHEKGVRHT